MERSNKKTKRIRMVLQILARELIEVLILFLARELIEKKQKRMKQKMHDTDSGSYWILELFKIKTRQSTNQESKV